MNEKWGSMPPGSGHAMSGSVGTDISENAPAQAPAIGEEDIRRAEELLEQYRQGKRSLDARIVDEERWFQLHHDRLRASSAMMETMAGMDDGTMRRTVERSTRSQSAWLFSTIRSKHADDMDNVPTCVCLPREQSDEQSAKILSSVIPVILERCDFPSVYSKNAWTKNIHGMCAYGVFWDPELGDGLGDVSVRELDVLKVFWQPGVRDIEDSANLFIVDVVDRRQLASRYPQIDEDTSAKNVRRTGTAAAWFSSEYPREDAVDYSGSELVVDWYYKRAVGGRWVTHYVKFACGKILYASENDPYYRETGWYAHGQYPVVIDVLYPMVDTVTGFGLVAIGRGPQEFIDMLNERIDEYADNASRVRYWAKRSMGVDAAQFSDPDVKIVDVEGDIDEERLRQIEPPVMDMKILEIREQRIAELKETCGARDVNQGSTTGGVTAAAAIASLQEAGNKNSRDEISSAYRSMVRIVRQVIELLRQFYDEERTFAITDPDSGMRSFIPFSNAMIRPQATGISATGEMLFRKPIYDIDVRAQKMSPYSQLSQNQTMQELYKMGVFLPQQAQPALGMLNGMDFPGIDQVRDYVRRGHTLYNILMQMCAPSAAAAGVSPEQMVEALIAGQGMPMQSMAGNSAEETGTVQDTGNDSMTAARDGAAQVQTTSYQQTMAQRARTDAERRGEGASVK